MKQQPGSPPFSLRDAVTNGASFIAERIAQGGISATFGFFEGLVTRNQLKAEAGIGAVSQAATTLPTTLGGLTVLINGTPAPLFFVSARQVNFQMPYEIEPGEATMVIRLNGKSSGEDRFVCDIVVSGRAPEVARRELFELLDGVYG